jgi:N-glycosyltransferase
MNVLLTPFGLPGHAPPFLAIAEALARRGHHALVYCEPAQRAAVERAGAVACPSASSGSARAFARATGRAARTRLAGDLASRTAPDLLRVIERERIDLVVVDAFHLGAALAARRSGTPWASLPTAPVLHSPRFRDWPSLVETDRLRASLGLPACAETSLEQGLSPQLSLLPWSREFDLRPPAPHWLHLGPLNGPCAALPPPETAPEILLSLSTAPSRHVRSAERDFVSNAVAALNEVPLATLITLGNSPNPRVRPRDHVRIVRFVDHAAAMPSVQLLMTHGGWGAIGRALRRGAPVLVFPFENDTLFNGEACKLLRFGDAMPPAAATPEAIRAAALRLLDRAAPERRRVAALSQRLCAFDPCALAVDALVALARVGPAATDSTRGAFREILRDGDSAPAPSSSSRPLER